MSGVLLRPVCTAAVAAGAVLAPVLATAVPEPGGPGDRSVAGLLTCLQTLYREAEKTPRPTTPPSSGWRSSAPRVQVPRPGARIKVSPVAANPVLGAVRPDPDGEPLRLYVPTELPEGTTEGSDAGYAGTAAPAADPVGRPTGPTAP